MGSRVNKVQYGCGGLQLQNQDMVVSESNFAGQLCLLVKNATSECFVARRVYAWGAACMVIF